MNNADHRARVKKELTAAGVTSYGQIKMTTRYLPHVIQEDEHIGGVIYGVCARGLAMLVATDKRVIYLERKPLFSSVDELAYDVVSGVQKIHALSTSVELHTRLGNYNLRYVNTKCAHIFVEYIEDKIEHRPLPPYNEPAEVMPDQKPVVLPIHARDFLKEHELCVLSTADRTGNIHSAVVYYMVGEEDNLYIMTAEETQKAKNMQANEHVALTVYDADELKTVQLQGIATIEKNQNQHQLVLSKLIKVRDYGGETLLPPVTKLAKGAFVIFKITPTDVKFSAFKDSD